MITLIAAAALAAQAPAAPPPMAGHAQHDPADHKGKDCCKDMTAKHDGHGTEHAEASGQ